MGVRGGAAVHRHLDREWTLGVLRLRQLDHNRPARVGAQRVLVDRAHAKAAEDDGAISGTHFDRRDLNVGPRVSPGKERERGQRRRADVRQHTPHAVALDHVARGCGRIGLGKRQEWRADAEQVVGVRRHSNLETLANRDVLRLAVGEVHAVDGDRVAGQISVGQP